MILYDCCSERYVYAKPEVAAPQALKKDKVLFPNNEKKYTKWAQTVSYYIEMDQIEKALKKIKKSPLPETASSFSGVCLGADILTYWFCVRRTSLSITKESQVKAGVAPFESP